MNNILFKHELLDAWMQPLSSITIVDSNTDNVIINDSKFTLSQKDIERIKELLTNKKLYSEFDVVFPPVLDGTSHKIYLAGKKEIECSNLWYWVQENVFDSNNEINNNDDKEFTAELIKFIGEIQHILDSNNIDFYILDDEDDE